MNILLYFGLLICVFMAHVSAGPHPGGYLQPKANDDILEAQESRWNSGRGGYGGGRGYGHGYGGGRGYGHGYGGGRGYGHGYGGYGRR